MSDQPSAPDVDRPEGGPTIVITYGWALGTPGGVARHLRELSRHLALAGAKVVLVCVSAAGYSSFPRPRLREELAGRDVEAELATLGIEVVRVSPHRLHWMLDGVPVRNAVARLLDERHVDVVLGFYNEAALLPELLEKRGVPFGYIATWLSYRMALSRKRQGTGLRGLLLRNANRRFIVEPYQRARILFANSRFTRRELVEVLRCDPGRIRVTYLGVDPSFREIPREEPESITRFLFFGRLVREKGIADAIVALGRLAASGNRDWTFRVLGSGNLDHVRRLAGENGIGAHLDLSHHQEDAVLREELARAHVALLPSYSESFGLAIAESQLAGLPVIAYHAGSVPEVVEDGKTAWLAPRCDVQGLYHCIREAIASPRATWERGLLGRDRIGSLFSWEKTAAKVLAGLEGLGPGELRRSA